MLRWKEEYATGVPRIDEQHRMLFQMGEDFRVALDEGGAERVYENLLDSHGLYVQAHFGLEERCMAACSCPAGRRNSDAHARFIETLGAWRGRHDAHGYREGDARELVDFLDRWLSGHIAGVDVEIRDYAAGLPAGWAASPTR